MVSVWPIRMSARESRPLAATTAATVAPCWAAMPVTVSPDRTVCETEPDTGATAPGAGAAAVEAAAPGIVSDCPMRMKARESSPLAATTAATVVPCFAAMRPTVSPGTTV